MSTTKDMNLGEELILRGLISQISTEHVGEILNEKRVAYVGVDPTADSIHVGNLITYIFLEHLLRRGHTSIMLVGGATGLIGDPSGKDEERVFSQEDEVLERAKRIKKQLAGVKGLSEMPVVDNYTWFKDISSLEFLRDVGKFFTVNSMIKRESVARRLKSESGISFTEFSYALLQGYDFYHLNEHYNCDLQIGGSDQWGNIVSGIDLIRKKSGNKAYGITIPLIVDKSTGKKFGKSAGNAVWLDPTKTSYYDFYQFWINVSDENVIEYLKLFTFLSLDEIEKISNSHAEDPQERKAQKVLAFEVTSFVHGPEVARDVSTVADVMFKSDDLSQVDPDTLTLLERYAPIHETETDQKLVPVIVNFKLAKSNKEAKRFLSGNAIKVNGATLTDDVDMQNLFKGKKMIVVTRGRKHKVIIKLKRKR